MDWSVTSGTLTRCIDLPDWIYMRTTSFFGLCPSALITATILAASETGATKGRGHKPFPPLALVENMTVCLVASLVQMILLVLSLAQFCPPLVVASTKHWYSLYSEKMQCLFRNMPRLSDFYFHVVCFNLSGRPEQSAVAPSRARA